MTRKRQTLVLISILFLFTAGCVPQWQLIEKPEIKLANASYSLKAPVGWKQLTGIGKTTFITNEGPSLQTIEIAETERKKAFESLKIEIKEDVLISELADYFVADFKTQSQGTQVNHTRTIAATIDSKPAFKVFFNFTNHEGLFFEAAAYGLMHNDIIYTLYYQAPRIYYFARDEQVFEDLAASFKLLE
jgi:hypothetical protein